MYVIGTAGHVDHGKSTLITALTNIDPDRLPQEKERGMTLDLGFAWLTLPSGREVSIVDVPGHERFVKHMLAGVGGIDIAFLVVAADEGVMPQTREHLAILDLLRIKKGLVIITKVDLVDRDMVELVISDVEDTLRGTTFEGVPSIPVSAISSEGLQNLTAVLDKLLDETEPRPDLGRIRLPIDRSFTVSGFGTVVTGTLLDGSLAVGQEMELVQSGQTCRVRGLQSHLKKRQEATPGRRVAANLSGVSHDQIQRGEVMSSPGSLKSTSLLDAHIRLMRESPKSLRHNQNITFHAYTTETQARIRLLDREDLKPGEDGWAQIHLKEPVPLVKDDLFIIRSPETTLGGGQVVDASPRRHRRFVLSVIERLTLIEEGTGEDVLLTAVEHWGPCTLESLEKRINQSTKDVTSQIKLLTYSGQVILLGDSSDPHSVAYSCKSWQAILKKSQDSLEAYHSSHPLRKAVPRENLRSRLGLSPQIFNLALSKLVTEKVFVEEGTGIRLPDHSISLNHAQIKQVEEFLNLLKSNPFSPPTEKSIDPELLNLLVEEGKVVKAGTSVVFHSEAYIQMQKAIVTSLKEKGRITVAEVRDMFNTSRKYVMALMDYLDQQHITRRTGDERVLLHDPDKISTGS